jgi:membrane-associated protease RseP (regulator of RpoE activity)
MMNDTNVWKWIALILVALIILTGCFWFGSLIGGTVGYTIGRSVARQGPAPARPPEFWEPPEMPHEMPQEARPWLGVYFQMTDEGAEIMDIIQGSPAEDADLQIGDVITEVNGEAVTMNQPLDVLIGRYEPGDRIRLTVLRDGDEERIRLRLGTRPMQMPFEFDEDDLPFILPPSPGEG